VPSPCASPSRLPHGCALPPCSLQAEQEKQANIIRAEAARLVSEALLTSPALVELRRLEAAKDIADTLARSRNVTYLPSGGNQSLLLSLGQAA